MNRLRIKNWADFQHYKDRAPPWIKLHYKLLHSKDWVLASDSERVLAIASMLLASQDAAGDGSFDADPEYFRRVAYLHDIPDFNPLIKLGFLERASACKQTLANVTTETETETETEKTLPSEGANAPDGDETHSLWRDGPKLLAQLSLPERSARSNIGRWLKSRTAGQVLDAIRSAHRAGTQDPIPYVNQTLAGNSSERLVEYLG